MVFLITIFLNLFIFHCVSSSSGDSSTFYTHCIYDCQKDICSKGFHTPPLKPLLGIPWTLWTCKEDCDYNCQWETVDGFISRKWPVPQFHGKWPFLRIFGLQEPASAIFSLLNFAVIVVQLRKLSITIPPDSPYYFFWHLYSGVCLNAWIWSTVYHTRDSDLTERLDYISASVMVFAAFFAMTVRVFELGMTVRTAIWTVVCICILVNHVAYLWFFKFDYGYNMLFNIITGSITVLGWLTWAAKAEDHPSRSTIASYCLLMAAATCLELLDFPPLFWIFDAHSLWHLSTAFIVILFYRFIRSDCIYLRNGTCLPTRKFD